MVEGHPPIHPLIIYVQKDTFDSRLDTRATSGIRFACLGAFRGQEGIVRPLSVPLNVGDLLTSLSLTTSHSADRDDVVCP